MGVSCFKDLLAHVGHKLECVTYGDNDNVAIECVDCNTVLLDFDNEKPAAPRPESYKITRKTADGKTLFLVSSIKLPTLKPLDSAIGVIDTGNANHDLAWSRAGYHQRKDRVSAQTEAKSLAGFLMASWARTGFCRTLNPGDRVYAHNERTKCRYLIFSVNKPSDTDIKMGATISMSTGKKFR